MNPRLDDLYPYPFERLRKLFEGSVPPKGVSHINLGIGEPQHPTPPLVLEALHQAQGLLGKYPPTAGTPSLRRAISAWHQQRYGVEPDPETEVLPVAGTREALFAFAQAVLDPADPGVVVMPNPFYQIYEGAALMAGAKPYYVATPAETGFKPNWDTVPASVWGRVRLLYICSPGNPSGAVMSLGDWKTVFELQDRYGFVIASDECYSELYNHEPPVGALQAAVRLGRGWSGLVSFNSLSKRSSAPGLRSGVVAGDQEILRRFLLYRTYHGCAPSLVVQAASEVAWGDEIHVAENREKYREKFRVARSLGVDGGRTPDAGFFLWIPSGAESDEAAALRLYRNHGLTVLPGSYLAREADGQNPGLGRLRVALVPEIETCQIAMERLREAGLVIIGP